MQLQLLTCTQFNELTLTLLTSHHAPHDMYPCKLILVLCRYPFSLFRFVVDARAMFSVAVVHSCSRVTLHAHVAYISCVSSSKLYHYAR